MLTHLHSHRMTQSGHKDVLSAVLGLRLSRLNSIHSSTPLYFPSPYLPYLPVSQPSPLFPLLPLFPWSLPTAGARLKAEGCHPAGLLQRNWGIMTLPSNWIVTGIDAKSSFSMTLYEDHPEETVSKAEDVCARQRQKWGFTNLPIIYLTLPYLSSKGQIWWHFHDRA